MLGFPATFAHRSFAFNEHIYADGTPNAAKASDTVIIDRRRIEPTFRDGRDVLHLTRGGTLGRALKGMTFISLQGRIIAPLASQQATVSDRERAMLAAFDPDLCSLDSPTTEGAYAFDFSEPTADTTNYPTGIIGLRYYCRPASYPSMDEAQSEGGVRRYSIGLVAADPRCYEQAQATIVLVGASSGAAVNKGTVPAPLRLTLLMGGAGASDFTISRGGVSFVLNLSTATAGQSVVVVMETCGPYGRGRLITKAGVDAFGLKTSGPATWLDVPAGSTTFTVANATNVTSATLAWFHARA